MNRSMNIMAVQRILQNMERESSMMDMKDDMMNDVMEDALGDENDAMGEGVGESEESDTILREVLDEIGVSLNQQVRATAHPARRHTRSGACAEQYSACTCAHRRGCCQCTGALRRNHRGRRTAAALGPPPELVAQAGRVEVVASWAGAWRSGRR